MGILTGILDNVGGAVWQRLKGYERAFERDRLLQTKPFRLPRSYLSFKEGDTEVRLVFEVIKEAQHKFDSEVTQYPVENNSDITDHIVNKNGSFSVSLMFSNANHGDKTSTVTEIKANAGTIRTEKQTYELLTKLRTDRKLVKLRTPLSTYQDLVITSLSFPKGISEGIALHVDITFEAVRKVSTKTEVVTVQESSAKDEKKPSADTKTDEKKKGKQEGGAKSGLTLIQFAALAADVPEEVAAYLRTSGGRGQ